MTPTKDPEIISVDVPMQVMDHDPDTVWRAGMNLKRIVLHAGWNGWNAAYTSKEAAENARAKWERDPRFAPTADDVYESTLWAVMDDVRALGGYGVILRDESLTEVRRWTVWPP